MMAIETDFDEEVDAVDDSLNRIIWHSVRGNEPYPARWAAKDDD